LQVFAGAFDHVADNDAESENQRDERVRYFLERIAHGFVPAP
jgi:hypothetical protein